MCYIINHWLRKGKLTECLNHNVVRSIAMMAGVELLEDGNLISLACHLVDPYYYLTGGCVDPLCERGTVVACEAKSVSVHPAGLLDDV